MKKNENVSNYVKFLKQLKFNVENDYPFMIKDMAWDCEVDRKTTQAAARVGILDIVGRGKSVKYVFNVPKIEPIHARNVMNEISKMQNEKYKQAKEKASKQETQPPVKTVKKEETPSEVIKSVQIGRVKTMTVKTVRKGLFKKEVTTSYTYE